MALTRKEAEDFIAAFVALRDAASDEAASFAPELYPTLKHDKGIIEKGKRIKWGNELFIAKDSIEDIEDNNPDAAPDKWKKINYKKGYKNIQPNLAKGHLFMKGEIGWWQNKLYESLIDNNDKNPSKDKNAWQILEDKYNK